MSPASFQKASLVAVVDDYAPFRVSTCRLLESWGFATCAFGSVADFVASGAMSRIDCLLLDVIMPEINGFAFQDCLRRTNYQFPIIFCSGCDDSDDRERALAKGAVYFLQKPVKAEALAEAVRSACGLTAAKSS